MKSVTFQNTFRTLSLENLKIHLEHYCKKGKKKPSRNNINNEKPMGQITHLRNSPINKNVCAEVRVLHLNKLESPLSKDDSLMYFRFYVIIPIWKRTGSFIWTNVNPLYLFTTTTDKFRSGELTWAFGSGELKRAEYISSEEGNYVNLVNTVKRVGPTYSLFQINYSFPDIYNTCLHPLRQPCGTSVLSLS